MACTSFEVSSPVMVDAHIQRWTITNDDIYLMKFHEEPPLWLEDIIKGLIDQTGLIDSIDNLMDAFSSFEEGYTNHFYDYRDGDDDIMVHVEAIYGTNITQAAGIRRIEGILVNTVESKAWQDNLVAAWMTDGGGGAWFNERVSVIANIAYSAAYSASTLTATLQSQQINIAAIVNDISVLEKQVDGKVVTWFVASSNNNDGLAFDTTGPVYPIDHPEAGKINVDGKPYYCWLPGNICPEAIYLDDTTNDTRPEHTGDTYVYFEYDAYGNKRIISTWRFGKDPYSDEYNWFIFTDDIATQAYEQALEAQITADSKITTYYQKEEPNSTTNPGLDAGDIWISELNKNIMYWYTGTTWIPVRDADIIASVDRIDEATVSMGGIATAKSSLVISAGTVGSELAISGYVGTADNTSSTFKIFADNFILANTAGASAAYAPFYVNTVDNHIYFNGITKFENIRSVDNTVPNWVFSDTLTNEIDRNVTTIDGGKITTGYIDAKYLGVDTVWVRGMVTSGDYTGSKNGYIGTSDPQGFMMNASAGSGSYNEPNIYGSYIRGGEIYATHLTAVRIDAAEIYGGYIYGGVIEAGELIAPSINGMKFKMGTFYSNTDHNQSISIAATEGRIYNKYGQLVHTGDRTAAFSGLVSVVISLIGPEQVTRDMNFPVIIDRDTFIFDRDDSYGNNWFSYVAWGY